jgi:acyl-coenzyme A thioesterase PaaI-like protein
MSTTNSQSLQERYAPHNACFGCGPSNSQGLRIRSIVEGELVVAEWTPAEHHQAFPGVLNGGIIGTLLDCHCNWTATYLLMKQAGAELPEYTVTSEYTIKLKRPTPIAPLRLEARPVELKEDRATIEGTLISGGKVTATCRGLFIRVKKDHPAYKRW